MSGKFFVGFLFGILLSMLALGGAGYYFFIMPGQKEAAPVVLGENKEKVAMLSTQVLTDISLSLAVPPLLNGKVPEKFSLNAQLIGTDGRESQRAAPLNLGPSPKFTFRFPLKLVPGDYRLTVYLCPVEARNCDWSLAQFEARTFFSYGKEQPIEMDVGSLPITRVYERSVDCFSSPALLSGKVEATDGFLAAVQKKKLALVLLTFGIGSDTSPKLVKGEGGLVLQFPPPLEQYISYAGPLEAKKEGFAFTAPPVPTFQGPIYPMAVECVGEESYKDCAKRAFPIPANFNSAMGRVYRMVGKSLVVPRCGMKNVHLILHNFPAPGSAEPNPASLPPEFVPGAVY